MLKEAARQGEKEKHRGIFQIYVPLPGANDCPSCRRPFSPRERRSSYNGIDVCGGCAAVQRAFDALEKVHEIERQMKDLAYRVGV